MPNVQFLGAIFLTGQLALWLCASGAGTATTCNTLRPALSPYPTWVEASMSAERLEGEGIPSVLVPLGAGAGAWGSSTFLPHELRVWAEDAERARQVLGDDEP